MRDWMYATVKSCPTQAAAFGDRIFTTGTVAGSKPGDSPTRPFIVIRFSERDTVTRLPGSPVRQQRVQVWIHNDKPTMLTTDDFVDALEKWCPSQAPHRQPDGDVIMSCEWEDTSGDGYDDHYKTNTRYVTFLVTYRLKP